MSDPINHPSHYTSHPSGRECIEYTERLPFCLGNALKYLWRAGLKGDAVEDLRKAAWYLRQESARTFLRPGLAERYFKLHKEELGEIVRPYTIQVRRAMEGIFLVAEGGWSPEVASQALQTAALYVDEEIAARAAPAAPIVNES